MARKIITVQPTKKTKEEEVKMEESEEDEETEEEEEETEDARDEWEQHEDAVADLVCAIKNKLAQIDPGIGDKISLARFVRFVEANSTSLM
jgi:TATA-binding protein-associated factor Taf7